MTDKLAELIADLDKTGVVDEYQGQDLVKLKAKIRDVADSIPIRPLGFYVLIKMEKVEQAVKMKDVDGQEIDFQIMSDDELKREQGAYSKGWVLAFGPTAYAGYAGHGEDGMCANPGDWGVEVGDYVEFQSYNGILSAFDSTKTLRIVPDSNIVSKVRV